MRGNAADGSDAWVCLRCPAIVCVDCYMNHTEKAHPECYDILQKRPTEEHKKNKKGKKR